MTIPLATVAATLTERNAPTRLSAAEMATAVKGLSAPVAIEVAMALAVSWKPLVKSKAMAVITTIVRMTRSWPECLLPPPSRRWLTQHLKPRVLPIANTKIGENISLLCAYRDAGKGVNHVLFVG